jgi:hemolysin D
MRREAVMSLRMRLQAGAALGRRYWQVFRHAWRHRTVLDGRPLAAHEAEFLPAAIALQTRPVSPAGRVVAYLLVGLVGVAIAWAVVGQLDIVVGADGKVIPSAGDKIIASVEIASVRAIHVREGQDVRAGDLLLELDAGTNDADRDKAAHAHEQAVLQVARARALLDAMQSSRRAPALPAASALPGVSAKTRDAEDLHLQSQYRDLAAKLHSLDMNITRYAGSLPLVAQQAEDYRALEGSHDVAPHAYLQKEQARIDLEGQLAGARAEREALVALTRKTAFDDIAEGSRLSSDALAEIARTDAHAQQLRLTAPVDGTVQQLTVHTVHGVVSAAQQLMLIVPRQQTVEIEARLEDKDVGFVHEGQPVAVKVAAYEYTRYGTVDGRVTHVSHDAIQDDKLGLYYTATIAMDRPQMRIDEADRLLTPGLQVSVEIKTGTRRLISYALGSFTEHARESLHER